MKFKWRGHCSSFWHSKEAAEQDGFPLCQHPWNIIDERILPIKLKWDTNCINLVGIAYFTGEILIKSHSYVPERTVTKQGKQKHHNLSHVFGRDIILFKIIRSKSQLECCKSQPVSICKHAEFDTRYQWQDLADSKWVCFDLTKHTVET